MLIELLVLVVLAALAWYVVTSLPLPPIFAQLAQILIVIVAVLWLLDLVAPGHFPSLR